MLTRRLLLAQAGSWITSPSPDWLSFAEFGADGEDERDLARNWRAWLQEVERSGRTGFIPAGRYNLERAERFTIQDSPLRIIGAGAEHTFLDGAARNSRARGLFELGGAGLTLSGLSSRNLMLVERFSPFARQVDMLHIEDWAWRNDQSDDPTRALAIFADYESNAKGIASLRLHRIRGRGGVSGLIVNTAIEEASLDDIDIRAINTPDIDRWFRERNTSAMLGFGVGSGVILGEDRRAAQRAARRWTIGRLHIDGVHDARRARTSGGRQAACDGLRLLGANIEAREITIANVSNATRKDCTGLYLRGANVDIERLTIINAGHHEASLTLKAAPIDHDELPVGGNTRLRSVHIENTEGFVGRPAIYLRSPDVVFDEVYIKGCGGDVEDPDAPGERINGASCVIRMSPPHYGGELGRASFGQVTLEDCILGGLSERWAIGLGAYTDIDFGAVRCMGLSNAGLFSTQQAAHAQNLSLFGYADGRAVTQSVQVGTAQLENCAVATKDMRLFVATRDTTLDLLSFEDVRLDSSVSDGVYVKAGAHIGQIRVLGGDLTRFDARHILRAEGEVSLVHIEGMPGFLQCVVQLDIAMLESGQTWSRTLACPGLSPQDRLQVSASPALPYVEAAATYHAPGEATLTLVNTRSDAIPVAGHEFTIHGVRELSYEE